MRGVCYIIVTMTYDFQYFAGNILLKYFMYQFVVSELIELACLDDL